MSLADLPILVVDDNLTNRAILTEQFRNHGMKPVSVDSGYAALEALLAAQDGATLFPLVVLDVCMPDMDGFETVKRIRACPEFDRAGVILLTSVCERGNGARRRQLGIQAYLDEVSEAIRAVRGILRGDVGSSNALPLPKQRIQRENRGSLWVLRAEEMRSTKSWPYGFWGAGGHSVLLARNGLEALDILNQHVIDVVLMDVQMAEIDGLQATANICKREQESGGHIPIFSMTAYAMKAIWNNAWRPELTATSRSRSTPKN